MAALECFSPAAVGEEGVPALGSACPIGRDVWSSEDLSGSNWRGDDPTSEEIDNCRELVEAAKATFSSEASTASAPGAATPGSQTASSCAVVESTITHTTAAVSPMGAPQTPQQSMSARPQISRRGESPEEVWPEHWGITLSQCKELMVECKQDPAWRNTNTIHTLVQEYVKPRTSGIGMGYALMKNQEAPLEISVMVSHTWAENAEEFFETLERSVGPEEVMFICALSLYQNEDAAGPSIAEQLGTQPCESPFKRVLDSITRRGNEVGGCRWRWRSWLQLVQCLLLSLAVFLYYYAMDRADCVPTLDGQCAVGTLRTHEVMNDSLLAHLCAFPQWEWHYVPINPDYRRLPPIALALFVLAILLYITEDVWLGSYRGRMVAVPNRQCDLYSRLWCVYEIFVATTSGVPVELGMTLAPAGKCCASTAICSSDEDTERIHREIEAYIPSAATTTAKFFSIVASCCRRVRRVLVGNGRSSSRRPTKSMAFAIVDGTIGLVTHRAHRSILYSLLGWTLPFSFLALAKSHGVGYTARVEIASTVCTGVQTVIVAGVLLAIAAFTLAKTKSGEPSGGSLVITGGVFVAVGLWVRVFDMFVGLPKPLPLHHCFAMNMVAAGLSFAVFGMVGCCFGKRFIQFRWRVCVVMLFCIGMLAAIVLTTVSEFTIGQIFPMAVWYAPFRVVPFAGYPAFLWLAAARWGVVVGGDPSSARD